MDHHGGRPILRFYPLIWHASGVVINKNQRGAEQMKKQSVIFAALLSLIAVPAFAIDCIKQLPGVWEYVVEHSEKDGDTKGTIEFKTDATVTVKIPKYKISAGGTYSLQDQKYKTVFDKRERTFEITGCTPDTMTNKRDDGKVEQFKRVK